MLHVGSSPTSVSTVDTNYILRHFTIDFRTSIKNPFKSHRFAWISKYVTRYFHNFPSCNTINILLRLSTKRLIWNEIQLSLVLQDICSFEVNSHLKISDIIIVAYLTYILYLVWLYYLSHCLLNWTQCKCNCLQKLLKSSEVLDFDCYLWYRPQCYAQQLFPRITNWLGNYYWFMQLNKYILLLLNIQYIVYTMVRLYLRLSSKQSC